jgi:hypothetical protein
MSSSGFWPGLRGRQDEWDTLSRLVASAQAGRSQVLILRGEAGIGKTALLEFLADSARGCQVGRAAGGESELAYSGLHQLCSPPTWTGSVLCLPRSARRSAPRPHCSRAARLAPSRRTFST